MDRFGRAGYDCRGLDAFVGIDVAFARRSGYAIDVAAETDETSSSVVASGIAEIKHCWQGDCLGRTRRTWPPYALRNAPPYSATLFSSMHKRLSRSLLGRLKGPATFYERSFFTSVRMSLSSFWLSMPAQSPSPFTRCDSAGS